MIVRRMRPEEFDATMTCFGYYADEAMQSLPRIQQEYDENSVLETIRKFASQYEYCWFNAYDGQRVVGFIAGYMTHSPWNENQISANMAFVYLLRSHRNLENFRELYNQFEEWARLIDAYEITAGDIGIDIDRSRTLYEHLGFEPMLLMRKGAK